MIPEREGRQRDVVDVLQGGAQVLRLLTDIADRANQVSCKLLLNLETPVVSDRRAAHVGADELPAHSREAAVVELGRIEVRSGWERVRETRIELVRRRKAVRAVDIVGHGVTGRHRTPEVSHEKRTHTLAAPTPPFPHLLSSF